MNFGFKERAAWKRESGKRTRRGVKENDAGVHRRETGDGKVFCMFDQWVWTRRTQLVRGGGENSRAAW